MITIHKFSNFTTLDIVSILLGIVLFSLLGLVPAESSLFWLYLMAGAFFGLGVREITSRVFQ